MGLDDFATILKYGTILAGMAGVGVGGYYLYKKIQEMNPIGQAKKKWEDTQQKVKETLEQGKEIVQKFQNLNPLMLAYQKAREIQRNPQVNPFYRYYMQHKKPSLPQPRHTNIPSYVRTNYRNVLRWR